MIYCGKNVIWIKVDSWKNVCCNLPVIYSYCLTMDCFAAELAALLTRWGYNNVDAALVMAQVDADGDGEIDKVSRAQQKIVSR